MAHPDVVTLGVAIAIPDPWGTDIQETRAAYGDTQAWTIPTHITLLPPMQVPSERLGQVDEHLGEVARRSRPFSVTIGPSATFRPVTATVFLQVGEGADTCEELAEAVRSGPLRRRLQYSYHPHVTLAFEVPDGVLDKALDDHRTYSASFVANMLTRYELGEDGIWLPEQEFDLGSS